MTKCITKEGQVYYGKVPADVTCDRTEAVKGSVAIVASELPQSEPDSETDTSFFSRKPKVASSRYSCTGKQHCSQMSSCEEAKFYIQNCPNTKMDGDRDGIPCERQLCRGW
ncbi:calcium-binding protein [Endozoicomonas sp. OPT23]|nr:calcium-binding protein [Endozoicomonas sp. OPT23]